MTNVLNKPKAPLFRIVIPVKGEPHENESICKTLHTNSNWSVSHVGVLGLLDGVVVDVDDLVQVFGGNFHHLFQPIKVVGLVASDVLVDGDGSQVTNCHLFK